MSRRDLRVAAVCHAVGVLLMVAAWIGASGATTLPRQAPFVNLGVVGLLLTGCGNAHWLARAHRDVEARTRRLLGQFDPGPVEP